MEFNLCVALFDLPLLQIDINHGQAGSIFQYPVLFLVALLNKQCQKAILYPR